MKFSLTVLNAFIEDTCVIVVIAYLLARGYLLRILLAADINRRQQLVLGLVLGCVGMTEIFFPGARSPYMMHSLLVIFATLAGGLFVGVVAAALVVVCAAALHPTFGVAETASILTIGVVATAGLRKLPFKNRPLLHSLVTGIAVQTIIVVVDHFFFDTRRLSPGWGVPLIDIMANGFGVFLLRLIVTEAQKRAESETNRLALERSDTLVAQAQLAALRARVHPHFLFNALTSIAALCSLAPAQAQQAVVRLSQLMRRALDANPTAPIPLSEETDIVRAYLEIEQHRLGARLKIVWEIDEDALGEKTPAFSLQTLVENAIIHGVSQKLGPILIRIVIRKRKRRTVIAVCDTGAGMTAAALKTIRDRVSGQHGLSIVAGQLQLLYGSAHRLRIRSQCDSGTLAAFSIPSDA